MLVFAACVAAAALSVPLRAQIDDAEPTATPSVAFEDLAFVVNTTNPAENVTRAELRRIFLAETGQWPNGRRTTLVMREPGDPERAAVLKQLYRMSEREYDRYFLEKVFRGEVPGGPKLLSTPSGVRRFVFNVPGAIGYVRASELDGSVKALRVEGHAPGEGGYPLKVPLR